MHVCMYNIRTYGRTDVFCTVYKENDRARVRVCDSFMYHPVFLLVVRNVYALIDWLVAPSTFGRHFPHVLVCKYSYVCMYILELFRYFPTTAVDCPQQHWVSYVLGHRG